MPMVLPEIILLMMVINVLLLEAFALCCEATRPRCFAFLAIGMFLAINGSLLKVEPAEAVNTMLALAAGDLAERGGLGEGLSPGVSPGVYKEGRQNQRL
jgi:hypothetical protein